MFFTEVKPERIEPQLTHGRKIWTIGSCFSDEIGRLVLFVKTLVGVSVKRREIILNKFININFCHTATLFSTGAANV